MYDEYEEYENIDIMTPLYFMPNFLLNTQRKLINTMHLLTFGFPKRKNAYPARCE